MSNVTIFRQPNSPANTGRRELSDLAKKLAKGGDSNRRIATNVNGTFKRMVNGEQIGKPVRGEINVIIVNALEEVSRVYYENDYDPNAEATLPDCWSNKGDKPEPGASNKQGTKCVDCPMNVKGSGKNGSRACRYQRRIAVLLENDPSGDIYQLNVPAMSLFGKGVDNVHPFESYRRYLPANGASIDQVVTAVTYDLEAESMTLRFSPVREISDDEWGLVQAAQANPESERVLVLTVAQQDKVEKLPPAAKEAPTPKPKPVAAAEPDDEEEDEPVVRPTKKAAAAAPDEGKPGKLTAALDAWADDEDDTPF